MKKDKNLHKILLVDWYEAIDFLPIGYKLKDYIRKVENSKRYMLRNQARPHN